MSREEANKYFQEGLAAINTNDKSHARQMFIKAVELDPFNENAWLWLAGVAVSPQEMAVCLRRVLVINPSNEQARIGLKWAAEKQNGSAPIWKCPFDMHSTITQGPRCSQCNAVLSLSDIDAILNNTAFECPDVSELARRYEEEPVGADNFSLHSNLALIYLNLRKFGKALSHLQELVRIRPDDPELAGQVETLVNRLNDRIKTEGMPKTGPLTRGVILVVDDSATVRKLVTIVLQKESYTVVSASDGMEALTLLSDRMPDLILMDITMPKIDGYTLCRLIKNDEKTKDVPVVMLSGKDGFFDKVRGRMSGSTDHISKPFEPAVLIQAVDKHIKAAAN